MLCDIYKSKTVKMEEFNVTEAPHCKIMSELQCSLLNMNYWPQS